MDLFTKTMLPNLDFPLICAAVPHNVLSFKKFPRSYKRSRVRKCTDDWFLLEENDQDTYGVIMLRFIESVNVAEFTTQSTFLVCMLQYVSSL
jgi:hypothetical protein